MEILCAKCGRKQNAAVHGINHPSNQSHAGVHKFEVPKLPGKRVVLLIKRGPAFANGGSVSALVP